MSNWFVRTGVLERERREYAGVVTIVGQLGFWCDGLELVCVLLAPGALLRRAFTIEVGR